MMQWLSTLCLHRLVCDPEDEDGSSSSMLFLANINV